ncbi:uncharacterized protein TrAtP1_002018 [Trichoderma atroviride]|uniref:uncharacterized protein n=1 Tax=Hypocrea atroviridis TaxID=63577 RepID=UPI0033316A0E|nr:hypothetical protein TrAtP1_002018 [Trichoderma atroviride]
MSFAKGQRYMLCVGHKQFYTSQKASNFGVIPLNVTVERYVAEASSLGLLFQDVDNKGSAKENGRLVNVVMLITGIHNQHFSRGLHTPIQLLSHLRVPTPPASSKNAGPSCRVLPAQRIEKARKMCPCATMSTSPDFLCGSLPSDELSAGS